MGAIKKHYPIQSAVQQILKAEIDIALICHKGPDIETAFEEILRQADNSELMANQGKKAVQRILRIKERAKSE